MSRRITASRAVPPSEPSPQARSSQSASIAAGELVAADDMDLDLLVLAAQADDAVARDRVAAGGEMIGDARGQALDRDGRALAERRGRDVAAGRAGHQRFHQRFVADPLARDGDHQRVVVLELELLERALQRILVELGAAGGRRSRRRSCGRARSSRRAPCGGRSGGPRRAPCRWRRSAASDGCGCCASEARISTWSPFSSIVRSGTTRPLTLAPTVWSPRSVWTA